MKGQPRSADAGAGARPLSAPFALSPGGRGQDGSPVITFPDYPAFSDVPDKEFQNVMTYLTSIPRCVAPNPQQFGKGPLSDEETVVRGGQGPAQSYAAEQ